MKVAIAGSGWIVKDILNASEEFKRNGIIFTHIFGRKKSENKLKELKESYNLEKIFFDYDDLIYSDADAIYIALPNHLHFEYAKRALEAGKNVIVEKPFTQDLKEANKLFEIAKKNKLFIFEAISTRYLPNLIEVKNRINDIGNIKTVNCVYSTYSSRYDRFLKGDIEPAFSLECAGGALMDINSYNVQFVASLFGKPRKLQYLANIDNGIDTSGILMMDYGDFKASLLGGKDSYSENKTVISGDKGYIRINSPVNSFDSFTIKINGKEEENINLNEYSSRLVDEFIAFRYMIKEKKYEECYKMGEITCLVSAILTLARESAAIVFPTRNL